MKSGGGAILAAHAQTSAPLNVTISLGSVTDPTNLDTIPFVVSSSKPVSEFELASVVTSSGTPQNFVLGLTPHASFNAQSLTDAPPISVTTNSAGHIFTIYLGKYVMIWDKHFNLLVHKTMDLFDPTDIALNSTNHIFVVNSSNIVIYDRSLNVVDTFNVDNPDGSNFLIEPVGLAFNSTGYLYLVDRGAHRVLVFDHAGNVVDKFGVQGNGDDPSHLFRPRDMAFNSTGHIFIVDAGNDRVRIYDSNHVHQGDISDGLGSPFGIAIDPLDNIYISEIDNDRIFIYNNENVFQGTHGSRGSGNKQLNDPLYMNIDGVTSLLYVADNGNNRIQILDTKSHNTFQVVNPDTGLLTVTIPANTVTSTDGSTNTAPSNTVSVTVDHNPPVIRSAFTINNTAIQLEFSEPVTEYGDPFTIKYDNTLYGDFWIRGLAAGFPTDIEFPSNNNSTVILSIDNGVNIIEDTDTNILLTYTSDSDRTGIQDAAGNPLDTIINYPVTNLVVPLTVSLSLDSKVTDPTSLDTIPFTVSFNKPVSEFELASIVTSSGTPQNFVLGLTPHDTRNGTFQVVNPDMGVLTVTILANAVTSTDRSTNTLPSTASVTVERSPPVIRSAFTINDTAVQLEFSEPITNNSTIPADFTFNGITTGSLAATGIEFPSNNNSTVILSINDGVNIITDTNTNILLNYTRNSDGTGIQDAAGNPLDTIINYPVTNFFIHFTVSLSLDDSITNPTSLDTIPFTVSFSMPVSEFEPSSVVTSSGIPQNYMPELAPYARFNANLTPTDDEPISVTTNSTGHIFTVHSESDSVKIWDEDYNLLANTTVGLEHPTGIELNATGHIFVANAHNIAIYDDSLNLVDSFNDDDNPDGSRISDITSGLAFNSTGFLYLADRGEHHILVFDHSGDIVDEFGMASNSKSPFYLYHPSDITFNSTGHIFITDTGNSRVRIYDNNHVHQGDISGGLSFLLGISIDSLDNIYISKIHDNTISVYDSENNLQSIYGSLGQGDRQFFHPSNIHIDETTDLLYVADIRNNRIQILDTKSGTFNVTNPDFGALSVTVPANAVTSADGFTNTAPSNTASVIVDRIVTTERPLAVALSLGAGTTDPTSLAKVPFDVYFNKHVSEFELASVVTSSGVPQRYTPELTPYASFNANLTSDDYTYGVAVNATGHIFTTHNDGNIIRVWDSDYNLLANTTMGLRNPTDITLNSTGHIFVVNDRYIAVYDDSLNLVDNFNDDDNPDGSRISGSSGDLEFNSAELLYLADRNGHHILVFNRSGDIVDEFYIGGRGNDPSSLSLPRAIAFNSTGHIFITDSSNNRVRIYDSNHVHQGDINNISYPLGMAIDSLDNIYVESLSSGNVHILIYDSENNLQGTYDGGPSYGSILSGHITIDKTTGLLYVADFGDGRIQILDAKSGTFKVANPDFGILSVTIPANAVTDMDGSTNMAPSNTASVRIIPEQLTISLSLGDGVTNPTNLAKIPFTISFSKPISEFELPSDVVTSSGVPQDYMPKLSPHARFNAQLASSNDSPFGATTNATGHIFTTHPYNNYVKIWDEDYNLLANTTVGLEHPTGIELNATGHIFVANAHNITVYDDSLNLVDTFDDLDNSRISEVSGGLAFNSTGYLYLADRNGHHILVFNNMGDIVDEFGVYGRGNDTSHLYFPNDVTFNSTGHIFVADDGNNRIRIYDSNHVYQGDIGGELSGPRGVAIDSLDNIYISEHQSHHVSIYDNQNNLQGIYGSRGSDNENFISPDLLNIDYNTGLLYLADSANGRIQILDTKNGIFNVVNASSDDILTVMVPANAVTDIDGLENPAPSNTAYVDIDTTAPVPDELIPELSLIAGTLTFDFSDVIDVSEINLDGIIITDRNGQNPISLTGATTQDVDSDVVTITLTSTQRVTIFETYINNGPVRLDVASDAIPNMFGVYFAGLDDISLVLPIAVSERIIPSAVSAIDDMDEADLALERVISVDTIVIDDKTYAVAASNRENGIQIIDVTDPDTPIPVSTFVNGTDSSYLVGPWSVTTSIINDVPYVLVAANGGTGGFVIIDMSNPANPTLASERTDGQDGFDMLLQARAISAVNIDGASYALVGSNNETSIHVVDVSDPTDPDVISTVTHGVDGFLLDGPRSISMVTIHDTPYAVVASFGNHTQIIDMSDPGNPLAVSHLVDDDTTTLSKPRSVDTILVDDNTYAVVASQGDNGIQIINITDPVNPVAISSVTDTDSLALESARYITTTSIDGNTYAVVAGRTDNGIQVIDMSDPANPEPVYSVFDGAGDFTELEGASSISVIVVDGVSYAIVASIVDGGIQIVNLATTYTTLSIDDEILQCIVP